MRLFSSDLVRNFSIGFVLGPLLVGGVAALAGGTEGWRWAFVVLAIPPVIVGLASITLKEPQRGQFDQESVLGGTLDREEQVEAHVIVLPQGRVREERAVELSL